MCANSNTARQDLYSEPRTLFNFQKPGIMLQNFFRQNLTAFNKSCAFSLVGSLHWRAEGNRLVGSHDNPPVPLQWAHYLLFGWDICTLLHPETSWDGCIIISFCSSLKREYSFLFALVWFLPADSSSCCDPNLRQTALKKGLTVSSSHPCTVTCVWSSWLFLPYTRISGPGHVCWVLPGIQLFTPLRSGFPCL